MLSFDDGNPCTAARTAHAALDSRLSYRRQRTQGSEFRPLDHRCHHRRSRLATDQVLRDDKFNGKKPSNKERRPPRSSP